MSLKGGITYMHEHTTIDLSGIKKDMDCKLDAMDETIDELKGLKAMGVTAILDVTNRGMGRNMEYMLKVMEATGINIIPSTGYYKEPFLPDEVYRLSDNKIAKIMVNEILQGIDGTGVRAGAIGEVGTGKDVITEMEKKVLKAASIAHAETGRIITTHTTLGKLGLEQVKLFKSWGVELEKVIIGHVDLSGDIEYILKLIDEGVYVAFDTIGKANYLADEKRVDMLAEICKRGLSNRVVMSMDITRKSHLKSRGGLGYAYLLEKFVPLLEEKNIDERDIENMLINNPRKLIAI